nr:dihydrofolate reductase family protein [Spelaeicoccus albus]
MPPPDSPDTAVDDDRLAELYAAGTTEAARWLRVNMVSTLDGAAMGADGRSGSISSDSDKSVFQTLRAWSDVVLIGAETARVERYTRLSHEHGRADVRRPGGPLLAIVSATGRVDVDRLFSADGGQPLLLTCRTADPDAVREFSARAGDDAVLIAGDTAVDLPTAVDELTARGLTRILSEGGPHLLGGLLAADLVDELDLTIGLEARGGEAGRIVQGVRLDTRFAAHTLLGAGDSLIGRWLVSRPESPDGSGRR